MGKLSFILGDFQLPGLLASACGGCDFVDSLAFCSFGNRAATFIGRRTRHRVYKGSYGPDDFSYVCRRASYGCRDFSYGVGCRSYGVKWQEIPVSPQKRAVSR